MRPTHERTRESIGRVVDALAGPAPGPWNATPSHRWHFAIGPLAFRGVSWGVALGALAPATTALDLLAGLAADGVSLTDSTDLGFFFGFVPLATAIVAVLLSWNHWPLRDLTAYRREMTVALLAVGVVLLIELRAYGARVTSDEFDDRWLLLNGSLVLHVLLTYWILRLAVNSLTALHARSAGWPQANRRWPQAPKPLWLPEDTSRSAATLALGFRTALWGVATGAAAGAAAGTLLVPVAGTLVGAYLGAIYGLIPTAFGTAAVVVGVSWRRDSDPVAVERTVQVAVAATAVVALVGAWTFLHTAGFSYDAWEHSDPVRLWLIVVPVVLLMLRRSAPRLANGYIRGIPDSGPGEPALP